jgi:ribosomal protein S18 acetylase RimI-like enzyme
MGLFAKNGIARYQDVGTDAQYRGRGIPSALIQFSAQTLVAQQNIDTFVIVAMDQSNAHRLYVKCGFAVVEKTHSAYCRPLHQA